MTESIVATWDFYGLHIFERRNGARHDLERAASDLAVVRITGVSPTHFIDLLKVPPTNESLIERRIRVLGFPPLGGGTITVTRGVVSGFDEVGNLKTDAEINPGNSGGAAFDDLDSFLGIPSFIVAGEEGKLGFLISADRVKQWLAAALKSGLPATTEELGVAFGNSNLDFYGDNLDQSTWQPVTHRQIAASLPSPHGRALPTLRLWRCRHSAI
jgi:S1-C subfamily serine protease